MLVPHQATFALSGADLVHHQEQGSKIRRCIIWRNKPAADERLRQVVAGRTTPGSALEGPSRRCGRATSETVRKLWFPFIALGTTVVA